MNIFVLYRTRCNRLNESVDIGSDSVVLWTCIWAFWLFRFRPNENARDAIRSTFLPERERERVLYSLTRKIPLITANNQSGHWVDVNNRMDYKIKLCCCCWILAIAMMPIACVCNICLVLGIWLLSNGIQNCSIARIIKIVWHFDSESNDWIIKVCDRRSLL